jgi:RimJ/RimL family protein N-acetyltransferase
MRFMRREAMMLDKVTAMPEGAIAAGRFILRPVRRSDAGLFAMYAGDKRVAESTRSIPHPLPPGTAEAFVTRATLQGKGMRMSGSWTDRRPVWPRCLGVISLKRMDETRYDRGQSEVGYWVAPAFWNAGFASEAVRALVEVNPQKNRTIFAEVFQDNAGSARVLTNAGFQYLGDAETFSVARNARVPTWTYIRKLD